MDTKFRSSFIPKASFEQVASPEETKFGLLAILAVALVALSLIGTGGLFFYKKMLEREADNLKYQLASAEAAVDVKGLEEIILFDKRLEMVKGILAGHVAVSNYFQMLENLTVSQIKFSNLKYKAASIDDIAVEMIGKAKSFGVIALQEDVMSKNENTVLSDFSGITVDGKTGEITFNFKGVFKSGLVAFKLPDSALKSAGLPDGGRPDTALEGLDNLPEL